ncbi:MAG TPA: NAD-dependent epimerase/dehydratase family protein [Opitutaceae bacterium]|nr:NAD-dependent epimerase/dehydratase family protein [Opitutaceae bacterium]
MATYLVTGVAGFIASRTAALLLEAGHEVVGVDNLNDYYDVRLKQHRLAGLARAAEGGGRAAGFEPAGADAAARSGTDRAPAAFRAGRFHFHPLDIEDAAALAPLFDRHRFDAVLNLAARAGVRYSLEHPHVYLSTNVLGALNLLELMRRHGVRKHVLASSSTLYAGAKMPFTEDQAGVRPLSPYAATKQAAEGLAYACHRQHAIDTSVVRYFTVYGPAGRPDMAPFRFIKWIDEGAPLQLFGDGTQARDFTYVDDIARGTIAAIRPLGFEVINLGGGRNPVAITDFIARIEKILGKPARYDRQPFHAADMKETWADIAKAGRLLGWKPEVSLDEGLRRTVDWHRQNAAWLKDLRV